MQSIRIRLKDMYDVLKLTNITQRMDDDVDVKSGRYIVSAKSILGLCSIDISRPVELIVHNETTNMKIFDEWRAIK